MTLPLNEKLQRMLPFLRHARHPRIFVLLARRGFSADELATGWRLFTTACGADLRFVAGTDGLLPADSARALIAELDDIENVWFPLVKVTLQHRFPALHDVVFENLGQAEGVAVVISMGTLLDRLDSMATVDDTGRAALALLEQRGFTPQVRDRARSLIEGIQRSDDQPLPVIDPASRDEQEAAIANAWNWYQEWSQIARTVIQRNDMLVRLGLRRPAGRAPGEASFDEPTAPTDADEPS